MSLQATLHGSYWWNFLTPTRQTNLSILINYLLFPVRGIIRVNLYFRVKLVGHKKYSSKVISLIGREMVNKIVWPWFLILECFCQQQELPISDIYDRYKLDKFTEQTFYIGLVKVHCLFFGQKGSHRTLISLG